MPISRIKTSLRPEEAKREITISSIIKLPVAAKNFKNFAISMPDPTTIRTAP